MEFTEKALVLRSGRFREADVWLRLLSPSRGVYPVFAFGGSKSRKRFPGCLDPFSLVLFTVGSDRQGRYLNITEGVLLSAHTEIRGDNRKIGVAANCAKFVEAVQVGPEGAGETFALFHGVLELLERDVMRPEAIPPLFRARIVFAHGYTPRFTVCSGCGLDLNAFDKARFFVEKGQVSCPQCREANSRQGLPMSGAALRALDWIMHHPPVEWPRLSLPPEAMREFGQAVEQFVAYHMGLTWENGTYKNV